MEFLQVISMDKSVFKSMINWVFNTVYNDVIEDTWKPCLDLSSGVSVDPCEKSQLCGLEFHHGEKFRIDIQFLLSSTFSQVSKEILPHWWKAYLSRCDQLKPQLTNKVDFFFQQSNVDFYQKRYDPMLPYCLPDCHVYEFDKLGDSMKLAGIFQKVHILNKEYNSSSILGLIERASEFTRSPYRHLPLDPILQDLCSVFGLPVWIGLMCGRNEMIKLVFDSLDKYDNNLELALRWFSYEFGHRLRETCDILNNLKDARYRICLDLNLTEYIDSPRCCIEVMPLNNTQEARRWSLLGDLQRAFRLPEHTVESIESIHQNLPYGERRIAGTKSFLECESESIRCFAANLNHYKICLIPGAKSLVKSYVGVGAGMN